METGARIDDVVVVPRELPDVVRDLPDESHTVHLTVETKPVPAQVIQQASVSTTTTTHDLIDSNTREQVTTETRTTATKVKKVL